MLYAGNSIDMARDIFNDLLKHRPRGRYYSAAGHPRVVEVAAARIAAAQIGIYEVETLRSLFTTADALLALSPEDLGPVLLRLARTRVQGAGFWPDSILNEQLSITHNSCADRGAQPDIGETGQAAPHHDVPRRRIIGAREVSA